MPFASSSMSVVIVESETKIYAIFLLYVFPNTRPAAFDMHCLINILTEVYSLEQFGVTLLVLFLQTKIGENTYLQFSIFLDSLSCPKKRLKAYLYGQSILSEDGAGNNLVTLRDC